MVKERRWLSLKRILLTILMVLTFTGCQGKLGSSSNIPNTENVTSLNEIVEGHETTTVETTEKIHVLPLDITIDDQKKVEELIYDYFNALENRDYLRSWGLMSTNYRSRYKDFEEYNNAQKNSIIESIKLVEINGYIPPNKTKEFIMTKVPEGVPTIWFEAYFDLKLLKDDPVWINGENERFVNVEKENGIWKINGLATSP